MISYWKGDDFVYTVRKPLHIGIILFLVLALMLPVQGFVPLTVAASELNYALNKPVPGKSSDTSAGRATSAVDGNASTYWQPLASDRGDDLNVWMTVDLTAQQTFSRTVLDFAGTHGIVNGYTILYSDNNSSWTEAYARSKSTGAIQAKEMAAFNSVTARYVRVSINLTQNSLFKLGEFEVMGEGGSGSQPALKRIYISDEAGQEYTENTTIKLNVNDQASLKLHGVLVTGEDADLSESDFAFSLQSSKPDVVSLDSSGKVIALKAGVSQITGTIIQSNITMTSVIWIDVSDPAQLIADLQITHPSMAIQIGQPALVKPGDSYPTLQVKPYVEGVLNGELVDGSQNKVYQLPETPLTPGQALQLQIPGAVSSIGEHQLRLTVTPPGKSPVYDTFYFFSADANTIPTGQSKLAFIGTDGKLVYTPDFKGNKLIDYSNSGYMGGGVQLPDVPVRVTLTPSDEGDDTARIQAAIDEVSQLTPSPEGYRGAVLLSKGTYRVGSKLYIRAGGVVLRGEGQDTNGTILYGTGTEKRNLLEIGGASGPVISSTVKTSITDLYVPLGARSFRVADPSLFKAGDTVMVRRKGNDRWIHELLMDQITDRPGTTDSTQQWGPFDLNFDRIITKVDGNIITVDAPLANSIELRWGGGELLAYDDSARIQQVGIENLRVDVNFDPSIVKSDGGVNYYADDNHPETFIAFKSVKNAWVRDITALHLGYAMVYTGRDTKWTTTQDSTVLEMASTLDGGRRYPMFYEGQLGLTQRVNVDTARHSYIVGSRVPGPNVFLDGVATTQFATSEPHHRWSVGGLFDNIDANIAIQDRGWLGSGHGWAGANWVAWNTKGGLALQNPPTAQNYAIGFTGKVNKPYLPNKDDLRPREGGYWESLGTNVYPRSLYLQQLEDRSGSDAVSSIQKSSYGEPALTSLILSDGILNPAFTPEQTNYSSSVTYNVYQVTVTPEALDTGSKVWVNGTEIASGQTTSGIGLNYGANTVQVAVYSPSLNASKTYMVTVNREQPQLQSVAIKPKYIFIRSGETQATELQGTYEDGATKAIVSGASFQSSKPAVAQISTSGTVSGVGPGVTTITAQYEGQSASAKVIVYGRPVQLVGLDLDSERYNLKAGDTHQTVVQAVYSDRSQKRVTTGVTYRSSNPTVAQVDANGLVKGIKAGKADIIVEYGGEQEKAKVTVFGKDDGKPEKVTEIELDDSSYILKVGQTHTTTVYAKYSDRSKKKVSEGVTYRSLNPSIVQVDAKGIVKALKAGKAEVIVEYGGKQTKAKITVIPSSGHWFDRDED
ncbi:Ig-like domain-containing protein [Paenibacillus sp. UNC451MF]|uniref:Ig-like domain-containing protein n=1 Tax=Paenibacillus sp. UNC451MF TaxID=1449063 RepID=UPI0006917A0C|nr:Ig-like domain-containing protein [Paenibacillus sp. UNC451MF]